MQAEAARGCSSSSSSSSCCPAARPVLEPSTGGAYVWGSSERVSYLASADAPRGVGWYVGRAGLPLSMKTAQLHAISEALEENGFSTHESLRGLTDELAMKLQVPPALASALRADAVRNDDSTSRSWEAGDSNSSCGDHVVFTPAPSRGTPSQDVIQAGKTEEAQQWRTVLAGFPGQLEAYLRKDERPTPVSSATSPRNSVRRMRPASPSESRAEFAHLSRQQSARERHHRSFCSAKPTSSRSLSPRGGSHRTTPRFVRAASSTSRTSAGLMVRHRPLATEADGLQADAREARQSGSATCPPSTSSSASLAPSTMHAHGGSAATVPASTGSTASLVPPTPRGGTSVNVSITVNVGSGTGAAATDSTIGHRRSCHIRRSGQSAPWPITKAGAASPSAGTGGTCTPKSPPVRNLSPGPRVDASTTGAQGLPAPQTPNKPCRQRRHALVPSAPLHPQRTGAAVVIRPLPEAPLAASPSASSSAGDGPPTPLCPGSSRIATRSSPEHARPPGGPTLRKREDEENIDHASGQGNSQVSLPQTLPKRVASPHEPQALFNGDSSEAWAWEMRMPATPRQTPRQTRSEAVSAVGLAETPQPLGRSPVIWTPLAVAAGAGAVAEPAMKPAMTPADEPWGTCETGTCGARPAIGELKGCRMCRECMLRHIMEV